MPCMQAFSQKGVHASRRPGTPLERKVDAFGRPNSGGERDIIFNYFPKYINISETK
jgi:hypothetical protein